MGSTAMRLLAAFSLTATALCGIRRLFNKNLRKEDRKMASVHDVAAYILAKTGEIPAMKLHKLVYYCQAWALVWNDKPLFKDRIEAWANGPAIPELYKYHRGEYSVRNWPRGDSSKLGPTEKDTIKRVLDFYSKKPSQWLVNLTHQESPWKEARGKLTPGERGSAEITRVAIHEYYSNL
jgi:uncharacterized phage-associated protein